VRRHRICWHLAAILWEQRPLIEAASLRLLGLVLLATFATTALHAQSYTCLPDTAPQAIGLRIYVVDLVTTTDPRLVAKRERYGLLPADSAEVTVVTKTNVCRSAGAAFHNEVSDPGTPAVDRMLVVLEVGNKRYVVWDPAQYVGEWTTHVIFDRRWNTLGSFVG